MATSGRDGETRAHRIALGGFHPTRSLYTPLKTRRFVSCRRSPGFDEGQAGEQSKGMETPRPVPVPVQLRLRVYQGEEAALGPGRADLLARIGRTASIAQAARDMGMSYMKAWKLIQSMNRCFREPLVEVRRGGKTGGNARLTATGETALGLYQRMEQESRRALRPLEDEMTRLLREPEAG